MKKKVLAFLTAVTMVFGTGGVLPDSIMDYSSLISASADTFSYNNLDYVILNDGTVKIIGYTGLDSNITIPDTIDGKAVTSIGSSAFSGCTSLTSLTIPNRVTSIGNHAFYNCVNLTDIKIPDSISGIEEYTFYGCNSLHDIIIPDSVKYISNNVFDRCEKLTNVTLSNSLISIGHDAFANCPSLISIVIPDSVTTLDVLVFYNSKNLENIYFSDHLYDIDKFSFTTTKWWNNKISENPIVVINDMVLDGENAKGKVKLSDGIWKIGRQAFRYSQITSIEIPESVTEISSWAFRTETLNEVVIPKSVNRIGNKAFGFYDIDYCEYKNEDFIIYCYKGTAGEQYAIDNGFDYELIEESKSITDCTITLNSTSYTYDGSAKKPSVTVKDGSTTLTNGTDYTISYSNNTNAGTGKVTITGTGNYTGSVTKNFTINAKSISNATVTLSQTSYTYDGNEKKPTVTVKDGTKTITSGTDYSVSYSNNINVGTAKVTVTGKGNYSGTASKNFTIAESSKTDISNCTVTLGTTSYTYDGTAKKPSVTVKNGSTTLTNGTDYTISYSNNTNAGTGKVTITGTGNYTGSVTKNFTINAKSISNATVTLSQTSFTYDGNEKKPTVTVKDGTKTLTSGTDYSVAYTNNINVGNAKVTVTGKGNFSGSKSINFTIEPKPVEKKSFEWGKDNWNFINSDSKDYENHGFTGGTNRDHISSTYLNKLIDQASNKETNRIYHMLDEDWNGSCFGMTSVIVLAKNGLLPYDNYTVGATNTYGLDKPLNNPSVDSLITYYLLSQNLDYAQQRFRYYYTTEYGKPELQIKRIISEIDKYGMANICDSNHSLLAYDYGYGSWRWYGVSYNGCIYLCDPNCSDHFAEEYCLYFNTNSYNWIIPHYGTRKSSIQGDYIDFVVGDPDILNTCGYLNNNPKSSTDFYYGNLTANLVAENHNVSKMIKSESGYTKTATNEDDIISCVRSNIISGDGEDVLNYILKDTKSAYILSQNNPEPLDLSIDYENCLLEAASPAGKSIIFDYNGYVKVDGESADYAISMTYNDSYPTDWFTIEVNGENANTASLEMVDNGWILSSDNLEGIVVNANNKEVKAATSFSTEYPSAFIYEIDENTIGIAVDTDNNGTYETTLNTESKTTISNAEITTDSSEYVFDDKAVEPIVTVKIGDEILKLGEDYTVEYVDNDKIGTAKIVVIGIGKYSGSTSMTFDIIAKVDSMLGDVNGNGKINVTDVSKTAAHVKGIRPLDENAQKRADVNGDNKINVTDVSKIAAHVKGIKPLN